MSDDLSNPEDSRHPPERRRVKVRRRLRRSSSARSHQDPLIEPARPRAAREPATAHRSGDSAQPNGTSGHRQGRSAPPDLEGAWEEEGPLDEHGRQRVKVRKRKRRSALSRFLRGAPAELALVMATALRRYPVQIGVTGAALLWWFWPWVRPIPPASAMGKPGIPEVISVFVEDPQRTIWAMDMWKQKPGSLLILQGRPDSQAANRTYLQNQGKWPEDQRGLVALSPGCDTVGQLTALTLWLRNQPRQGRVTMVTSMEHLPRTMAIARILLGSDGWLVEGLPVISEDGRDENALRLRRDQLRAQLWRATGWDGAPGELCDLRAAPARAVEP
jgi:hypothetical protein